LRIICEALLRDPGRQETLEQWSDKPAPAAGRWRGLLRVRRGCVLSIGGGRRDSPRRWSN
jgi:hypothetical protein